MKKISRGSRLVSKGPFRSSAGEVEANVIGRGFVACLLCILLVACGPSPVWSDDADTGEDADFIEWFLAGDNFPGWQVHADTLRVEEHT